jgi:hypothetical protein
MRALGPGSVSSFLKVALDVVYLVLWALLGVMLVCAVALLIFQPFAVNLVQLHLRADQVETTKLLGKAPQVSGLLVLLAVYFAALIVIINRLRRVFETLIQGDPFLAENVARLRIIGLGLIAVEGLGFLVRLVAHLTATTMSKDFSFSINLTAWFAILVVFVLAEVFREGARLRDEAELTI